MLFRYNQHVCPKLFNYGQIPGLTGVQIIIITFFWFTGCTLSLYTAVNGQYTGDPEVYVGPQVKNERILSEHSFTAIADSTVGLAG